MHPPYVKTAVTLAWVLAACAAGMAGKFDSPSAWALLACVAAVPPVVMLRFWHDSPTLSHSTQTSSAD
jgi:hypothetical protein